MVLKVSSGTRVSATWTFIAEPETESMVESPLPDTSMYGFSKRPLNQLELLWKKLPINTWIRNSVLSGNPIRDIHPTSKARNSHPLDCPFTAIGERPMFNAPGLMLATAKYASPVLVLRSSGAFQILGFELFGLGKPFTLGDSVKVAYSGPSPIGVSVEPATKFSQMSDPNIRPCTPRMHGGRFFTSEQSANAACQWPVSEKYKEEPVSQGVRAAPSKYWWMGVAGELPSALARGIKPKVTWSSSAVIEIKSADLLTFTTLFSLERPVIGKTQFVNLIFITLADVPDAAVRR